MSVPYPDWKTVVIDNDASQNQTTKSAINQTLEKLIQNDDRFDFEDDLVPDIWRCRWYNQMPDPKISSDFGYPKGYAVWTNTESLDSFIQYHMDEISAIVSKNSKLQLTLRSMGEDLEQITEFFKQLIFNENGPKKVSGGPYGEPIFYIGDISGKTQVKVSKIDNNIYPPYLSDYWDDMFDYEIFERNQERLSGCMVSTVSSAMEDHLAEYHLGLDTMSQEGKDALHQMERHLVKSNLRANLSSIDNQEFLSHRSESDMEGFDFIDDFQVRKSPEVPGACMWYRHWKSGYLEQGGVSILESTQGGYGDGLGAKYAYSNTDFIEITLPIRYDYPIQFTDRMYMIDPSSEGIIDSTGILDSKNRYVSRITTILKRGQVPYKELVGGNTYQCNDAVNVKNGSFWIRRDPGANGYSFYVSGFLRQKNHRRNIQIPAFS